MLPRPIELGSEGDEDGGMAKGELFMVLIPYEVLDVCIPR